MNLLRVSPALALLVLGALGVAADEQPLTLSQALEMAQQQNPDLLAARESAAAQAERAETVSRTVWPRLGLTSGFSYSNTPANVFMSKLNAGEFTAQDFAIPSLNDPDAIGHLTTALSVEVPLDLFGRVGSTSSGYRALSRAMSTAVDEGAQELKLRVIQAYRQASLAQSALQVTERALAGARAREADIEARVAEGAALQADLLRARARRRQREAELAERRGDASVARAALARALGAPAGASYVPSEGPQAPEPVDGDETAWVERALVARPAQKAAAQKLEGTRLLLRAEERGAWPELAVFGQVQDDRNGWSGGKQTGAAGAFLRFNLFDGGRAKRTAGAGSDVRAAEQELRAAGDQIRLEVEMAYRRAQAARERLAAARGGAEEGREALRVVQERRQAGLATLTDELETEAAALGAELEELRAATEAELAVAALRRAAGTL